MLQSKVHQIWYRTRPNWLARLLQPVSWLFALVAAFRRQCYRWGLLKTVYMPVPVVIVGNITVGGTGKTPFVIYLVELLKKQGYRPGIVSRGVGGKQSVAPLQVTAESSYQAVGDEALVLFNRTQVPVFVCPSRVEAAKALIAQTDCNIIVSDDGLQHYALGRDIEIALIDSSRKQGNGLLLPAGPLRESIKRLLAVDIVIEHGEDKSADMHLVPEAFHSLVENKTVPLDYFKTTSVHAVAGIAHPERFFNTMKKLATCVFPHSFKDHYAFKSIDLVFNSTNPIVMTEKDAVKCHDFATQRYWFLSVAASISDSVHHQLVQEIGDLSNAKESTRKESAGWQPVARRANFDSANGLGR